METIQLNAWAIFYAVIAIQGLIVTGILFSTKRGNQSANKYLAFLLLSFSLTRWQSFFGMSGTFEQWPHLIFFGTPFWYALAPLYFFYVRTLVDRPIRWNKLTLIHFGPFLIVVLFLSRFYILPAETKFLYWSQTFKAEFGFMRFLFVMVYDFQNLAYIVASIRSMSKPKTAEALRSTNDKNVHLKWLKFLLSFISFYVALDFVVALVSLTTGRSLLQMPFVPMAIYSILVYSVSITAILDPEKLFPRILRLKRQSTFPIKSKEVSQQLLRMMDEQKLYRNKELRYSDLATNLGISVSLLSKVLNEEIGQSFNDFVNTYRVQDLKDRLLRDATNDFTLLAIALDAGFNSKASFNRIFKRHTGMTPSQYVRHHKHDSI